MASGVGYSKASKERKIKIFLWYLKRDVILTKDNLIKRGWKGDTKCAFCGLDESIQHLFFDCYIARLLWNVLFITFKFQPPRDVTLLFGSWLLSFDKLIRNQVIVGLAAMC